MDPIEVVLFDLGGVVCDFRPERRLRALAAATGLAEADIHARIWGSGLDASLDAGACATAAAAHRQVVDALGAPLSIDALTGAWCRAFEPRAEVLALADAVRVTARTGLLTDNGPLLLEAMPSAFPEVARRFDWLLFSCAMKAVKPSRELFDRALERIGAPAGRVLLIDDSARNVEGALACGLQARQVSDVAALTEDLRGLRLLAR